MWRPWSLPRPSSGGTVTFLPRGVCSRRPSHTESTPGFSPFRLEWAWGSVCRDAASQISICISSKQREQLKANGCVLLALSSTRDVKYYLTYYEMSSTCHLMFPTHNLMLPTNHLMLLTNHLMLLTFHLILLTCYLMLMTYHLLLPTYHIMLPTYHFGRHYACISRYSYWFWVILSMQANPSNKTRSELLECKKKTKKLFLAQVRFTFLSLHQPSDPSRIR